jgi:putative chitinase
MVDYNKIQSKIPVNVFPSLVDAMKKFAISDALQVSHFLSQIMHESGNFKFVTEGLNYSADGLANTFPKRYGTKDAAGAYIKVNNRIVPNTLANGLARKPEAIANNLYADRMGNGNEQSGDGFKFCGRGYIQLTGKENYIAFGKAINEDLTVNPSLVATPKYASLSAAWFFSKNGLNVIADKGATTEIITEVTKKINGGTIGLPDRIQHFNEIYALLK